MSKFLDILAVLILLLPIVIFFTWATYVTNGEVLFFIIGILISTWALNRVFDINN